MLIELSYIISLDMPKWPTNPAERIEYNTVIQNGDPSNASSVFHHLHLHVFLYANGEIQKIQAMHLLYFTICIQEHM